MTELSPEQLPLQTFYRQVRAQPDKVYLTQPLGGGRVVDYTWREVADEALRMAAHLQAQGWPPGSRIAIISKNCAHWVMADLAIWMAGHVSVPVYASATAAYTEQVLVHCDAVACFIGKVDNGSDLQRGVPAHLARIALPLASPGGAAPWSDIVAITAPLQGEPVRAADDLATIVYTSGTTGMPKGVMHSFGTLAEGVTAALMRMTAGPGDRLLSYLPMAHIAERIVVEVGTLRVGARIYFNEGLDTFMADLKRAQPTLFISVPRLWLKFQQGVLTKTSPAKLDRLLRIPLLGRLVRKKILEGVGLGQVRMAFTGTAPIPADLLLWYRRLGLVITELYGMTEVIILHMTLPGMVRPGTVGPVIDGVRSRIDPATGEIQARGAGLMRGYYREAEQTRAAFTEDGWLRTGDKGEIDADGHLRIVGRLKDEFKTSKGKYVSPSSIENLLVGHPAVELALVAGASLAQPLALVLLGEKARGEAATEAGRAQAEQELAAHLQRVNATLPPHERLDCLVVMDRPWTVESGVLTPTLKVRRNKVESIYADRLEGWVAQRRPVVWMDG